MKIKLIPGLRQIEDRVCAHKAVRIDLPDALRRRLDLPSADRTAKRDNLPVEIGFGDRIMINKIHSSHSGAGQGLDHIPSDAAYAENGYAGCAQPLHRFLSQKEPRSCKWITHWSLLSVNDCWIFFFRRKRSPFPAALPGSFFRQFSQSFR